jgi:hypothetical protein
VNWTKNPSFIKERVKILICYYDFFLIFFFREKIANIFFKEGRYNLLLVFKFLQVQKFRPRKEIGTPEQRLFS